MGPNSSCVMTEIWQVSGESFDLIPLPPPGPVKRTGRVGIFGGRMRAVLVIEIGKKFRSFVGGSAYGERGP